MATSEHTCPHGGRTFRVETWQNTTGHMNMEEGLSVLDCGDDGWLCPACREDRADARNRELVEGLAMAGLLANQASCLTGTEVGKEVGKMGWEVQAKVALDAVRALRDEREGDEGS